MRSFKLIFMLAILVLPAMTMISCSEDDPEPEPEEPVGFTDPAKEFIENFQTSRRIVLPNNMLQADIDDGDEFSAALTTEYVSVFNILPDSIFGYFDHLIEGDADHSTTPVGGASGTADVYTWGNVTISGQQTGQVIYQVITGTNSYTFQLFVKDNAVTGPYLFKVIEATESFDHSKATFKYFLVAEDGDDDVTIWAEYFWQGDNLQATMTLIDTGYWDGEQDDDIDELTLNYNRADKSGNIIFHQNRTDVDIWVAEWDAIGNGHATAIYTELIYDGEVVVDFEISEPMEYSWSW